jgi:hypothetical protein
MSEQTTQDVTRTNRIHLVAPRYRKTATIRALRMDFAFTVQSKEGTLTGKPGDYLAIADDDSDEQPHRWIISAADFERTYEQLT